MPQIRPPFAPTRYITAEGKVTDLFRSSFDEVANTYLEVARFMADRLRVRPLAEFALKEVHTVGSVLRGVDNSDLDLLLIADRINWEDYRFIKMALNAAHFNNRSKYSALDWYVQPDDDRPHNDRFEVTNQLNSELARVNSALGYDRR